MSGTEQARSFGDDAAAYDRARPSYPPALVDALVGDSASGLDVVDVGCGTGKFAELLAARGCRVLGVEHDERMAAVARGKGIEVEVAAFESWDPTGRTFDLVASAQAWHWVDQVAGAAKAAEVLRPGGGLAVVWNLLQHDPAVVAAFRSIYERIAPELAGSVVLGLTPTGDPLEGVEQTGRFEPQVHRTFDWDLAYTGDEWLDFLATHSDHHALAPERLDALLGAVGRAVDDLGGSITTHWTALCITAVRR